MDHVRSLVRQGFVPWMLVGILSLALVALVVGTGSAQKASKQPTTVREVLAGLDGSDSNLGKIKRVTSEFVMIQDENTQRFIPFDSIQEIRLLKENASEPAKIEIRLIAKD